MYDHTVCAGQRTRMIMTMLSNVHHRDKPNLYASDSTVHARHTGHSPQACAVSSLQSSARGSQTYLSLFLLEANIDCIVMQIDTAVKTVESVVTPSSFSKQEAAYLETNRYLH
jgi:hypothetical protein